MMTGRARIAHDPRLITAFLLAFAAVLAGGRGLGTMKLANPAGAQFEILVDGKPRSYRDIKAVAIASAEFLKSKNPPSEVAVKDLESGEVTVVTRGWDR